MGAPYRIEEYEDAVAVRQALGHRGLAAPQNQGCIIPHCRMDWSSVGNLTFEDALELHCGDTDSGYLNTIHGQGYASVGNPRSGNITQCEVKAFPSLEAIDAAWSSATQVLWAGTAARLSISASQLQRSILISDDAEVVPVKRTDGGTKALVTVRSYIGTGNLRMSGRDSPLDDFSSWETRSSGLVRRRVHSTPGNQIAATSGWVRSVTSPLIGLAYGTRIRTWQGHGYGDSDMMGVGGDVTNESQGLLAVEAFNALGLGFQMSYANMAWGGQTTKHASVNFRDALESGLRPDWAMFPVFSVNDPGDGNLITEAVINEARARVSLMLSLSAQHNVTPILLTGFPANTAQRNWGSSDELRRDLIAEWQQIAASQDIAIADTNAWMQGTHPGGAGPFISSGQWQIEPGKTDDHLHPNQFAKEGLANEVLLPVLRHLARGFV